ncbi:IS3 family transposase [Pseudidiomarina insulisalsae]|uniref:IS3 family transposase n=1 Tax=Pseudidiomarina insulisalsae TaxID=575789 RepID=UPI0018E565AA|nr:IS3 family transposase [Pseudidiomarina insulisalsae]
MKSKRFSVEQIVSAIKQHEAGLSIAEIARKMGIAEGTFYAWKKKYSGLESDQVRELKQLREENEKLKRIVADLTPDKVMLQDLKYPKVVSVPQRRKAVRHLMSLYSISERRACALTGLSRTACRYKPRSEPQEALRQKIVAIARARVRYGYKRIHVMLKRKGIHVNKKRVHRLYCLEGLQLRPKRPRRNVSGAHRKRDYVPSTRPNEAWAMDFVADQLSTGNKFRILTVVDTFTRECLAADIGARLRSENVVATLTRLCRERGAPNRIHCDNGSEFAGQMTDLWAYTNKVTLAFSRPGKPTDNAYIESLNGSFRDECLNCHWFESLTDAKLKIEAWRDDYNKSRPHRALNNLPPLQFVASIEN